MKNQISTANITVADPNRDNIKILRETLTNVDFETGKMKCDAYLHIALDIIENGRYRRHPVFTNIIVDLVAGEIYRENLEVAKKVQLTPRSDGYYRISINKKLYYAHRIIMEAFIGEVIEDTTDGIAKAKVAKIDIHHCKHEDCFVNSIYNLRMLSHAQNCKARTFKYDLLNTECYEIVKDGEIVALVNTQRDVAKWVGGTQSAVSKACRGLLKTFHGYTINPVCEKVG